MPGVVIRSGLVALIAALSLAPPALAAFPGANGLLAVQPAHGGGIVLVRSDGHAAHRICARSATCGTPRRPRWSADGRALAFTGPGIKIIAPDGSCMSCQFEDARNAAFEPRGSVISSIQSGHVIDVGIDGLKAKLPAVGAASDAVWSARGRVAVVRSGAIWVGSRTSQRRLAAGSQPSWSPSGHVIAAVQRGWVLTIDVRNRRTRRLVRGGAPAFSPDGQRIAYVASGHRLMLISATSRPRPRRIGRIQALSVDWQPRPRKPIPGCVAPPGSTVLASSRDAVVTVRKQTYPLPFDPGLPSVAVMGCLRADGHERLLERFDNNTIGNAYTVSAATLAPPYAGLTLDWADQHYGGQSHTLQIADLRTGRLTKGGGQNVSCPDYSGGCLSGVIDRVVVGHDGVSAVHIETRDPIGAFATPLLHVACAPASTMCVVLDLAGHIFSSSDAAASSAAWHRDTVPGGSGVGGPSAVACPAVTLCVTVSGHIYTSTSPGTSTPAWAQTDFPTAGSQAGEVSCPSPTLCVVPTFDGTVVTSTNPTGGAAAWSAARITNSQGFGSVFCSSSPRCFVTVPLSTVFTSTNPAGGAGDWTQSSRTPPFSAGTCPTTTLCVAIHDREITTTTNPATETWTDRSVPDLLEGIACPSASLCLAVGVDGALQVSTDPAAGTWTRATIDQGQTLLAIDCPSASLCVATDAIGHVVTSTDPTGGPSTWHSALVEGDPCTDTTPCSEEQIQTSDRSGVHTVDTSKLPGNGPYLTGLTLTGDTLSWNHAGTPRSLTLHP